MSTKNKVGLDVAAVKPVVEKLSVLLANYQVFYTNLRGLHWNIVGDKFYELHELYEEYYNEFAEKIDEVAERIVMLGATPDNSFSQYLKKATIKEVSGISDWHKGVRNVVETLQALLPDMRELHAAAIKAGDHGTVSLMNHHIKHAEKKIWMLTAYLVE